VQLSNGLTVNCYIPGIGHNLQRHSQVLAEGNRSVNSFRLLCRIISYHHVSMSCHQLIGHRIRDCPGVNYAIVRGKYDCKGVVGRMTARSRYGVRKNKQGK
jgi:small subunit ribosomal protein S12